MTNSLKLKYVEIEKIMGDMEFDSMEDELSYRFMRAKMLVEDELFFLNKESRFIYRVESIVREFGFLDDTDKHKYDYTQTNERKRDCIYRLLEIVSTVNLIVNNANVGVSSAPVNESSAEGFFKSILKDIEDALKRNPHVFDVSSIETVKERFEQHKNDEDARNSLFVLMLVMLEQLEGKPFEDICMTKPSYKEDVALHDILFDGWSRDLGPKQTLSEAFASGYVLDLETVKWLFHTFETLYKLQTRGEESSQLPLPEGRGL